MAPTTTTQRKEEKRTWDDVLRLLSGLITFKTRADGKGWRDAFENMPLYMEVCRRATASGERRAASGGGAAKQRSHARTLTALAHTIQHTLHTTYYTLLSAWACRRPTSSA